jgi:hypothetical protein
MLSLVFLPSIVDVEIKCRSVSSVRDTDKCVCNFNIYLCICRQPHVLNYPSFLPLIFHSNISVYHPNLFKHQPLQQHTQ